MRQRLLDRLLPGRTLRLSAGVLWGAVFFWIGLHVMLNGSSFAGAAQERLRGKLAARFDRFELGKGFTFSWAGECWWGPLTIWTDDDRPTLKAEWIGVRPTLWGLVRGKLELGQVDVEGLELATDRRGERISALVRQIRGPDAAGAKSPLDGQAARKEESPLPDVDVTGARLVLLPAQEGDEEHILGPIAVSASPRRVDGGFQVQGKVKIPPRGVVSWKGRLTPAQGLSVTVSAKEVPVQPWVAAFTHAIEVKDGVFGADVALSSPKDFSALRVKVSADLDRLVLAGERVATRPVGPAKVGYVGVLAWDRETGTFEANPSYLLLGKSSLPIPIGVQLDVLSKPTFDAALRVGPVGLQELIATLPEQLVPGPSAPHLDGPVAVDLKASGPLRRPFEWEVGMKLDLSALAERAKQQSFALRDPFEYRPLTVEGGGRTIWVGTKNPAYVPLSQLPPILGQAVITSEDSAFYLHHGFDLEGLQSGLASAIEGNKLRGGSTLTQQLVKNIYLTPDRTYARKISEALIALQVEAALPKARILELYLNIIEWGPGVYRIGEASRYYFGVDARYLSPKQAAFLATIIPNPSRWGPFFKHQGLNDTWERRVDGLLDTLHERGFLGEDSWDVAIREPLRFRADSGQGSRALTRSQ